MKIAIQGVAGAFHEEAAKKFFGKDIQVVECLTFRTLCESVDEGKADFGIMAIENTIAGTLLQNYGYIEDFKLRITGEVYLRIKMNLMALPGTRIKNLKQVVSHPIALRQSAEYLASLGPDVQISEADDTALSAKKIADEKLENTGALAGQTAAEIYGLEILKESVETNKKNYTRFIILTKGSETICNANKASLAFEVRHRSGSLAEVLSVFAKHNVNLTKIQSVPVLGKPYQYSFHVDLEWDSKAEYDAAISEVLRLVASLSVYGEYVKGTMPE